MAWVLVTRLAMRLGVPLTDESLALVVERTHWHSGRLLVTFRGVSDRNQAEALRVAAGLTLLSDPVKVAVVGRLADTPAVAEQREVLEFAEVPLAEMADPQAVRESLAPAMLAADVIYVI